ncbi:hypothetical protein [Cystobacter ferrugineus]|uniref:Uncharacterized protein n=1 Tax=Cystobacter ferrugineus TaxID=83449 RepID=A0A1L9B9K0_9BACT|nr:hypothetical protein [Cystobacter ferrugineus]OJH38922.1 hypothetical protein BON30_22170 [Cystobacter ferrugineus]
MSSPHADATTASAAPRQASLPGFLVRAWTAPQRLADAVLQALIVAAVLAAAVLILLFTFEGEGNPTPPLRAGVLALLALGLYVFLRLLRWRSAATLQVEPERLVLERRGDRFEIPTASVESVRGWRLPLPVAGLALRMRSGKSFQYGVQVEDPLPVLEALGQEHAQVREEARHPLTTFAHARATVLRPGALLLAFKFLLFPLIPGGIMFRANQYITYGGPFAQYRMYGLGPYLQSFFTYWVYFGAALVVYAAILRVPAEVLASGGTWLSPRRARGIRRFVEITCALLYFVGSLALLAVQFLA